MLDGFTTHTHTRTHRHQNDMMMIYVIFMTFVEWKPKHQHFVSPNNNNNNGRKNSEAKWTNRNCLSHCFNILYSIPIDLLFKFPNDMWILTGVYMCVWYMFTLIIRRYTSVKRIFTWACDTHDGFFSHWMKIGCHNVNMNYQKLFAFFLYRFLDVWAFVYSAFQLDMIVWANKWCIVPAKYCIMKSWYESITIFNQTQAFSISLLSFERIFLFDYECEKRFRKLYLSRSQVYKKAIHSNI